MVYFKHTVPTLYFFGEVDTCEAGNKLSTPVFILFKRSYASNRYQ
ncbi:hypothetical Protein YC6258_01305 [Gynuella sunshinyii YC6258]|uniref:Uncharacterized protein n=1 Tax=Gynuella sunshinyii YC6258 TaxID=1445510 RepID=A0A0C5VJ01_9GAMM|nr:hypothetical Protein YC6258_01305 [Gynuella sunshinyii YC6258]